MPTNDQLRAYSLFTGLSDAELTALAPCITRRAFGKGAYLYYPGSPGLSLYLVESGLVRTFFADVHGREYLLNVFGPRTCIGLPVLPDGQARMVGAAVQQETVTLILMRDDMFEMMKRSAQFMQNVYYELANATRKLALYAQAHTILQVNGRLASLLMYHAVRGDGAGSNEIALSLTQAEIASWVGASRARINSALSKMQQQKLIRLEGKKIIILDLQGVAKMAEGLHNYSV